MRLSHEKLQLFNEIHLDIQTSQGSSPDDATGALQLEFATGFVTRLQVLRDPGILEAPGSSLWRRPQRPEHASGQEDIHIGLPIGLEAWRQLVRQVDHGRAIHLEMLQREVKDLHLSPIERLKDVDESIASFENTRKEYHSSATMTTWQRRFEKLGQEANTCLQLESLSAVVEPRLVHTCSPVGVQLEIPVGVFDFDEKSRARSPKRAYSWSFRNEMEL